MTAKTKQTYKLVDQIFKRKLDLKSRSRVLKHTTAEETALASDIATYDKANQDLGTR